MSKLFIIGNGFDLDLGLETSYYQFSISDFWPKINHNSPMSLVLEAEKREHTWFDIEDILYEYAKERPLSDDDRVDSLLGAVREDRKYFDDLTGGLSRYIHLQNIHHPVNIESVAAKVLISIIETGGFRIYSFNYTDLNQQLKKLKQPETSFKYVHGSCSNNSIILGVSDDYSLRKEYRYLLKPHNPNYAVSGIVNDLQNATEVVFFGHSLSRQDFFYFEDFFHSVMKRKAGDVSPMKITIFTKDVHSQEMINNNISELANAKMGRLRNYCDFDFIRTTDTDKSELYRFFENHTNPFRLYQ